MENSLGNAIYTWQKDVLRFKPLRHCILKGDITKSKYTQIWTLGDNVKFPFVVVNLNCQPDKIKNHLGIRPLGMPVGDDLGEGPRESKTMPRKNKIR